MTWLVTGGFVGLYVACGVVLRARVAAGAYGTDAPGWLIGAVAIGLAGIALGARPMARRVGLAYGPACLVAWTGAEGVAICALDAWVGGASTAVFAGGVLASLALLGVLRPTGAGRLAHDGADREESSPLPGVGGPHTSRVRPGSSAEATACTFRT